MNLKHAIQQLAHEFDAQDNAAHDLWTWLPSYKDARTKHGDYADEFRPILSDLLKEATLFISHKLNPTDEQKQEAGELYQCPDRG